MTLKQRFKKEGFSNCDYLEKVADEHAVAFTDWCEENYYPSSITGIWYDSPDFDNAKKILTKELLQIYKDMQGL